MRHVNIYTQTSFKGLKKQSGAIGYILECNTKKGPATLTKMRYIPNATPNEAELRVVIEALRRMSEKCEITIYTDSNHVAAGYNSGWVESWKNHNWQTVKGKEISHVSLWQELDRLLQDHSYCFEINKQHEYKKWLKEQVEKSAREGGISDADS